MREIVFTVTLGIFLLSVAFTSNKKTDFVIKSITSNGDKCSYILSNISFIDDCGKFNVGDIVSFERVK